MDAFPVLLAPLFGVLDRLFGADKPAFKGKKAAILAVAVVGGFLLGGKVGAAFGGLWFVYRCLPFGDGAQTPSNGEEAFRAIIRHLPVVPGAMLIGYWFGLDWLKFGMVFGVYGLWATGWAFAYGQKNAEAKADGRDVGDFNRFLEVGRGMGFGLATLAALSL